MDAYIYKAALYCAGCTENSYIVTLDADAIGDSDKMPQGPYPNGGGEADTPQHCDNCGLFLENPLTEDGIAYVKAELDADGGDPLVLQAWHEFYEPDCGCVEAVPSGS